LRRERPSRDTSDFGMLRHTGAVIHWLRGHCPQGHCLQGQYADDFDQLAAIVSGGRAGRVFASASPDTTGAGADNCRPVQ
jgi:hypothetical protein